MVYEKVIMSVSVSIPSWVTEEFKYLVLPDKRLETRAQIMLSDQYAFPEKTIYSSAHDEAAAKGAYRFQKNPTISEELLLQAHYDCVLERAGRHSIVLGVHDTTTLNFSSQSQKEDTGTLQTEESRVFLLHPLVLFSPDKLCLGVIDTNLWSRDPQEFGKSKDRSNRPIEEKESYRWLLSYRQLAETQSRLKNTEMVSVSDAESDIYDLFVEAQSHSQGPTLLVRASHNRSLEEDVQKLWPYMESHRSSFEIELEIPRKAKQPARTSQARVTYAPVTLKAPSQKQGDSVELYAVYVRELDPPEGVEAVSWMLLTTRRIRKPKQGLMLIKWYAARWSIEIFFKTLKTSCRILKDQTQKIGRFPITLAFKLILTWRIMYLTHLGRECPEISSQEAFEEAEWRALWCYCHKTPHSPYAPPSLQEATKMLARLGGYKQWKKNQVPEPQTLAKGLSILTAITDMWRIMNQKESMPEIYL